MPTRVRHRSSDGIDRAASANSTDSADRSNGAARSPRGGGRSTQRDDDPAPIIPILARRVREVEARVASKGRATPTNRTKFQVVALLMRAERARVKDDSSVSAGTRADLLKRLDGIATILATSAPDSSIAAIA